MQNIVYVHPVLVGADYQTHVWMSAEARQAAREKLGPLERQALEDKLVACAEHGFKNFEGHGKVIVPEGRQTFRFGIKVSLFRWWGFYQGFNRAEFIVVDWMLKKGQKRGKRGNAMADKVADIRDNELWKRRMSYV